MHFFRKNTVRRITLLVLLSWGVLTQITTVYACESENGKKQISCCCDDAINKDCKHNKSTSDSNKCDKNSSDTGESINLDTTTPFASVCCDISYGVNDASIVSSSSLTVLQVTLLNAPQPPPVLPSHIRDIVVHRAVLTAHFASLSTPHTDKLTYLRTQRLRI